jgi:phosphoribosylamine--glycine ligase
MKILLIDASSSFLDFALRCEAAGHEVRVFIGPCKDGSRSPVGDGLLTKVKEWQPSMKWADLILTSDNVKYLRELEGFRARGFPVFAPNLEVTDWELLRGVGQGIFEEHGIPCLPSIVFSTYDDAIAHLRANPEKRYVSKPTGDADKALSYVSKSSQDMLFMLEYWKKKLTKKVPFLFQEFTPGIEMAVGGWVGRNGFLGHFLENFEFKKLMPGEVGVNTGEMGTAMKYVTASESKLAQKVLLPLESALIRAGYTGFIDVSVIIDKKGNPWPLEFTSRPGWPLFQIQQSLHHEPCQWMLDALRGQDTFTPDPDIAVGVVVAMPDFPYSKMTRKQVTGFPVWGVTAKNRYNIHPCEMMLGEAPSLKDGKLTTEPMLVTAGDYVLVTTGTDATVCDAMEGAYAVLKSLEIPNSPIYRTDIGCRLEKQLPDLQALGYATAWAWE